ncbi:DUF6527 family protein [Bradyrhizobium algeriense]|uniref:DUF6527 family protein n=1 Tax=Bradyrhizobium algeriense TaxID=634784 RepID=UPI000D396587
MLGALLAKALSWSRLLAKPDFLICRATEMPPREILEAGVLVVVGPKRNPKWATFLCPSGCGMPLLLSLSQTRRPRWSVASDWLGRPSLSPSVRRTDGCRCHFWLRRGSVDWCADTGR